MFEYGLYGREFYLYVEILLLFIIEKEKMVMKVTVIGCWGGYPKAGEATSGYLFQNGDYNLLVDCGSAVLSNLQRYIDVENLNSLIISHYHYDHIADVGPLQYARLVKGRMRIQLMPLAIYGPFEDSHDFERLTMKDVTTGLGYDEEDEFMLGPFGIKFCRTKHPVQSFAVKVYDESGCVVYTGDSSYFEELAEFAKGADLIICECNLYSGQDGSLLGHMNSRDAANIAEAAGANHLLLTHLPQYGNIHELEEDASRNFKGTVELAQEGWSITI
jgi:ribonuclease BN (tRNA processing enzyme)